MIIVFTGNGPAFVKTTAGKKEKNHDNSIHW